MNTHSLSLEKTKRHRKLDWRECEWLVYANYRRRMVEEFSI